jgi:hypothetical protein
MKDPELFIRFFEKFKHNKYLHSYFQTEQVAYALKRICMRVWTDPFTGEQEAAMNEVIIDYRKNLESDFRTIFMNIEGILTN